MCQGHYLVTPFISALQIHWLSNNSHTDFRARCPHCNDNILFLPKWGAWTTVEVPFLWLVSILLLTAQPLIVNQLLFVNRRYIRGPLLANLTYCVGESTHCLILGNLCVSLSLACKALSFLIQKVMPLSASHPYHQSCQELWRAWDFTLLASCMLVSAAS